MVGVHHDLRGVSWTGSIAWFHRVVNAANSSICLGEHPTFVRDRLLLDANVLRLAVVCPISFVRVY